MSKPDMWASWLMANGKMSPWHRVKKGCYRDSVYCKETPRKSETLAVMGQPDSSSCCPKCLKTTPDNAQNGESKK